MKKSLIAVATAGIIGLTACGSKTVYVTATEAPETTAKKTTTTTSAPAETRPPSDVATGAYSPSGYDPEAYDTAIWSQANEFWWMFSTEELLQMGLIVCETFDTGASAEDVSAMLVDIMIDTGTTSQATGLATMVAAAVLYLCPEHQSEVAGF